MEIDLLRSNLPLIRLAVDYYITHTSDFIPDREEMKRFQYQLENESAGTTDWVW